MKPVEQLLKEAADAEMQTVRQETLRPLVLPTGAGRGRIRGWATPLAAGVAVLTVVVMALFLDRKTTPQTPAGAGADAPPFFVTSAWNSTRAVIRDARTGKAIAEHISSRGPYNGIAAAGDQRTFFLTAAEGPCTTRVDRIVLRDDGSIAAATTVPGRFGVHLDDNGLAVTADGERLALTNIPESPEPGSPSTCGTSLEIVDTASGRHRSWGFAKPLEPAVLSPSWGPDGRTLYYLGMADDGSSPTIRALDTQAAASTESRVIMPADRQDRYIDRFAVQARGDTITAVVNRRGSDDGPYTVERFSLSTGRRLRQIARMPEHDIGAVALDATGDHLLFALHGKALIRADDGQVRSLLNGHAVNFVYVAW